MPHNGFIYEAQMDMMENSGHWVRGGILLNTYHLKKLCRGQEDKRKPRTSEFSDSETLKQFNVERRYTIISSCECISVKLIMQIRVVYLWLGLYNLVS